MDVNILLYICVTLFYKEAISQTTDNLISEINSTSSINDTTWSTNDTSEFNELTTSSELTTRSPMPEWLQCFFRITSITPWNNISSVQRMCYCRKISPCVKVKAPTFFNKSDAKRWETYKTQNTVILVVYGVGWLAGIAGNVFVIVAVAAYLRDDSATTVYLGGLATADLLLVLFCFPLKVLEELYVKWFLGHAMCLLLYFIKDFCFACCAFTLTLISIERFRSVRGVEQAHSFRRACAVLAAVWILAIVYASKNFYIMDLYDRHQLFDTEQHICGLRKTIKNNLGDWQINPLLLPIHFSVLFVLVFAIPFILMLFMYSGICINIGKLNAADDWNGTSKKKKVPTATLR